MSTLLKIFIGMVLLSALASCQREEAPLSTDISNQNVTGASNPAQLSNDESTLIIAAAKGDTNTVKEMLDRGVKVDTRDLDVGVTALGHAAWFGHIDTAKLLIERGADVNAKKSDGTSVLALATTRNHKQMAEMLKRAGAK